MRGVIKALGLVALVLMLNPMKAKAEALPNFPIDTQTQLQLVEAQAENLTLAQEGIQPYGQITAQNMANVASILTLFDGLYRGLQSWNEWLGGDDYIVRRQAVLEHTQLPEWLADYSGEVIMWELEYFGHVVTMLTTPQLQIIEYNGVKGLNVTIKNEMREASAQYKVENPNPSRMNKPRGQASYNQNQLQTPSVNGVFQYPKPYISGKSLYFTVVINNSNHLIRLDDFTNIVIGTLSESKTNRVFLPAFKVDEGYPNRNLTFYDVTTNTSLSMRRASGEWRAMFPVFSNSVLSGGYFGSPNELSYFMPSRGKTAYDSGEIVYFYQGNLVSSFGFSNSLNPSFIQGQDGSSAGVALGLYLDVGAGQISTNTQNIKVPESNTISAQSLEDIQSAISVIEPEVNPSTGIEEIPIPDAFPEAENVPLEVVQPDPPIPPSISDFPQTDPSQVPVQDPTINPSTTPTEDSLPESAEDIQPMEELQIVTGLQNRFPFSIPWDIYNAYSMLLEQKEAPVWEWTMNVNLWNGDTFSHTFTLSMEPVDSLVRLFRDLFLLAFILGLAVYSYNKFFGGGA